MRSFPPLFHYQSHEPPLATELLQLGVRASNPHLMLLVAGVLALTRIDVLPLARLAGWLALVGSAALLGQWVKGRSLRHGSRVLGRDELRREEWLGMAYALAIGAAWGCSGLLLVPGAPEENVIVTMTFVGVATISGGSTYFSLGRMLGASLAALLFFLPPVVTAFPEQWPRVAFVVSLFVLTVVGGARKRSRLVVANLQLRNEREALVERARAEADRAHQANREKSAFLAAASHDLRQPLHAMMLTSHALSLHTPPGEGLQMVERILDAGRALSQQFDYLMDLSRLESGEYRLRPTVFPLARLLQQAVAAHRQVAEDKGLRLRLRLDRRLQAVALQTDAGLLARIVDNLLDNALKFSDSGAAVLLVARLSGGRVLLGVHDQGIGIAAGQQEQIFLPYVQLDNPTRDAGRGIGLGLSIVHSAAALLGAQLSLRSRPGQGSHFVLALPATLQRELPPPVVAGPAVSPAVLRGKHLLLVEDDARVAAALGIWLQNWGLRLTHYADPRLVPEQLQPELILCDVRLPGDRDGIRWLTEWLGQWPEARGLLLSGELTAAQRAEQEGLMMLPKPVDPEVLLRALAGMAQA